MQIQYMLNISNFERNLSWRTPFSLDNAKQALLAFRGQVYIGLDAKTLNESDLLFAQPTMMTDASMIGVIFCLMFMCIPYLVTVTYSFYRGQRASFITNFKITCIVY